jgi:hypothetical protein
MSSSPSDAFGRPVSPETAFLIEQSAAGVGIALSVREILGLDPDGQMLEYHVLREAQSGDEPLPRVELGALYLDSVSAARSDQHFQIVQQVSAGLGLAPERARRLLRLFGFNLRLLLRDWDADSGKVRSSERRSVTAHDPRAGAS